MASEELFFGVKGAASYLGLSEPAVKHHLYVTRDLKADFMAGNVLAFSRKTLDAFLTNKKPIGRPPGRKGRGA